MPEIMTMRNSDNGANFRVTVFGSAAIIEPPKEISDQTAIVPVEALFPAFVPVIVH